MLRISALLLALGLPYYVAQAQQPPVHLQLDPSAPGTQIRSDFLGLSFETLTLLPHADGTPAYFTAGNRPLIQLFHTLGIRSLRIGGNTADRPTVPVPTEPEIDQLFHFASAADVKVIYALRLRESSIPVVVHSASYLMQHYAPLIDCLAVGNEPNVYEHTFSKYAEDIRTYTPAILAAAPKTRFCGPGTNITGDAPWANGYIKEFGHDPQLRWLTQHSYPGGNSKKVPDPATGLKQMLSTDFERHYQSSYEAFVPATQAANVPYRIEETNSFYNGGAEGVSNTFASSLWALDFLYFWLGHGASGVNFHTGDTVAAGEIQTPCWYATFWTRPDGTLDVHPIAYAMKAFDLAAHGTLLPIQATGAPDSLKIYATRDANQTIYLTIVNKQMDGSQPPASIEASLPQHYKRTSTISLTAPALTSTSGVQLGGAEISTEGQWKGGWRSTPSPGQALHLKVPPASALLIKIER